MSRQTWMAGALAAGIGVLAGGYLLGAVSYRYDWSPIGWLRTSVTDDPPPGWWTTADGEIGHEDAALAALGYLDGTEPVPSATGVRRHDPERTQPGVNLYIAGHAAEARLVDLDGRELHRWARSFDDTWPGRAFDPSERTHLYWRRVQLRDDGGLYAIFSSYGLVRLDRDGEVVWTWDDWPHHDLDLEPDGQVVTLCKRERRLPEIDPDHDVLVDCVAWLDPETGELVRRIDLYEALKTSRWAPILDRPAPSPDQLHANTVVVLDGSLGAPFDAGRLLVSLREHDAVVVLDPETERVVWALTGQWRHQHDPRPTTAGTLLLLDNQRGPDRSALVEIDPHTQRLVWEWAPEGFYTRILGAVRRLPNGNTLAVESTRGRALEVAPDGEVVWEWVVPHRAGAEDQYVAALFDLERITAPAWLEPPPPPDR